MAIPAGQGCFSSSNKAYHNKWSNIGRRKFFLWYYITGAWLIHDSAGNSEVHQSHRKPQHNSS